MRRGRVRADPVAPGVLDAFCDALWLEDGLSQNTIAAYRADLAQLQAHLDGDLLKADEAGLFAFLAAKKGRGVLLTTSRQTETLPLFLGQPNQLSAAEIVLAAPK